MEQQKGYKFEEQPEQPRFDEKIACQLCQDVGLCAQCPRGIEELQAGGRELFQKKPKKLF